MNKNEIRNIFSANLKRLLKDKKRNRKGLANDLNIAYSRVCDWSRARTLPPDKEMKSIALYFNIKTDDLIKDIGLPNHISRNPIEFNEKTQRIRVYDLDSGQVIGHQDICYGFLNNQEATHISFIMNDDSMLPKYNIGDLVILEIIWNPSDLEDGDYLITDKKGWGDFSHLYKRKDGYLKAPLNINNSKDSYVYDIHEEDIKKYTIYKAIAVIKKI